MYWDQFAVRPEGSSDFNDTIHFVRKADALVAMRVIEIWIAAEREACAKVADLVAREVDDTNGTATYIAAAIRARGER
jgi:hypothetical protein